MDNIPSPPEDSALRNPWYWILLPVAAYLVSAPFLGFGALFVPAVVLNAPLGILGCFRKISLRSAEEWRLFVLAVHGFFWVLLFYGMSGCKNLPRMRLHVIWWILVTALVMSISGCAISLGPGLRDGHNWH